MPVILGVRGTSVNYFSFTKCMVIILFLHWNSQFLTWLSIHFSDNSQNFGFCF